MPKNPTIGIGTAVGILREFPESGLVPFYFVDGVMGLRPSADGLVIAPGLPSDWKSATLRAFHFAGKTWTVTVAHSANDPKSEPGADGTIHITVPAKKTSLLTPCGELSTINPRQ
jgi:cellobiose phosphorylase